MDLELFRREIEEIDLNILDLLNQRMINSLMISRLKDKIKDEEREKYIFNYVGKSSSMLLNQKFKREIFKNIIAESCLVQQKGKNILVVAQEEHHCIVTKGFKKNKPITFFTCKKIEFIFELLENFLVDYSIISKEYLDKIQDFSGIKIIEEFELTNKSDLIKEGNSLKIDLLLIGKGE